jgi:hypothetical protein
MMVHPGSYTVNGQQSYLTFSSGQLQNVRAGLPGCVLTSTVTIDVTVFSSQLQNEVCNGPNPCNFRGTNVAPGSMAFASHVGINPSYNGPDFRIAQVGFCVVAPGQAVIHWLFSPPEPITRDTQIITSNGIRINIPACYVDYTIFIPGATYTPTITPTYTPSNTPTITPSPTPTFTPTDTPTYTPTITPGGPTLTPTPGGKLVGHVIWQAIPQNNSRSILPITLTLKMGALEVNYPQQNTDSTGFFTVSVTGLPEGTYQWRVQGPGAVAPPWYGHGFLSKSGSVALAGAPQTNLEIATMRGGDADNNNRISVFDFNILKNSFGQSGYLGTDFDNNLVVNTTDYNILKGNFGLAGAPPPAP